MGKEWGGALRWLYSEEEPAKVRDVAQQVRGQATLFRSSTKPKTIFQPLPLPMLQVHQRMKRAFDPKGIFNIGRMFPDF